ncbi:MAG: hypothetical protein HW404_169 [Anaerolineales bacterium]|nr:hypothetical protein [Anaerolineales bacterium]
MSQFEPQISAIIVVGTKRDRAGRALQSLLSQDAIDRTEVILVDTQTAAAPVPGSDHPAVRTIPMAATATFGEARATGVRHAHGRHVAFLEEHAIAFPGWLNVTISALDGLWVGVGGEIHNANAGVGISDAVWLMNYDPDYRPPAKYGPSRNIPGHNSAYRRDVLMALQDELPPLLQSEVLLQWRLRQQGYEIGVDPAIKLSHLGETTVAGIAFGYYVMHQHFAALRSPGPGRPFLQRGLRVLATPLVPFVRFTRFVYAALRRRPADLKIILRFPLVILIAQCAAALGMAAGYLFGSGDSDTRFTAVETSAPRGE